MMYLSFEELFRKYDPIKSITGIVHVGACTGEEREAYAACGIERVLWFEANPETCEILYENVKDMPGNIVYNYLLSDVDWEVVDFHITSNFRAASSSMLPLKKHREHYPKIDVVETVKLTAHRLDGYELSGCNFLNMDVQGAELKVLKGLGDRISQFDYVYSEINTAELYEGCVLLPELESYLHDCGFTRQETNMTPYEWGDSIFVRNELIQ